MVDSTEQKQNSSEQDIMNIPRWKRIAIDMGLTAAIVVPDAAILWGITTAIKGSALVGMELVGYFTTVLGIASIGFFALAACQVAGHADKLLTENTGY